MKKIKILSIIGYFLGILFCLIASMFLVYSSFIMINWIFSEHPISTSTADNNYNQYNLNNENVHTIVDTIAGETVIFQKFGFEDYSGLIKVSYELNIGTNDHPQDIELYFIKSVRTFEQFSDSNEYIVHDYFSCQKKNSVTFSGDCIIRSGGGIMIYNKATTQKEITLKIKMEPTPSLTESF